MSTSGKTPTIIKSKRKNKKFKRKNNVVSAKPMLEKRYPKPSKYLEAFNIKPGDKVYLHCRQSTAQQKSCPDQERDMRKEVEQKGAQVVGCSHMTIGAYVGEEAIERNNNKPYYLIEFAKVCKKARDAGANIILAESTSRILRDVNWYRTRHRKFPATPSAYHFEELISFCKINDSTEGKLRLMTLVHPDAPQCVEESHQKRRSGKAGRPKGSKTGNSVINKASRKWKHQQATGRVQKSDLRECWMPVAIELNSRDPERYSSRKLAKLLSELSGREFSRETIRNWLRRHRQNDKTTAMGGGPF
ncbi:hypothetical protein [Crateriforma conspicua]|uniref:hypothetical protein n=1 Tax=Crateriforma conspicua TaxID=2527996 RepID=UPI001187B3F6|nr:hypothetical protein [Crateriforma conspicua]QDV63052.1 hypothetical protein Mal65_21910 [Crateriforma conspicua]